MEIRSEKDLNTISLEYRNKIYRPDAVKVNVGMASCGIAAGAKLAYEKAKNEFSGSREVQICQTGCLGFCE